MAEKQTKWKYEDILQQLVAENLHNIFDEEQKIRVKKLKLSDKLYNHPLSYGRLLTVFYRENGSIKEKQIFVKFRLQYRQIPNKYMEIYDKFSPEDQFLPKFYFSHKIEESDVSIIGIEFFKGVSLRNLLLMNSCLLRSSSLSGLFFSSGLKMRMFHDAQNGLGYRSIADLIHETKKKTKPSCRFNKSEREKILAHISRIEASCDPSIQLPLIHIHHDWSLRNIIVDKNRSIKVIDWDAYNRSIEWRWHDVAHFLINIESQVKYYPVVRHKHMLHLWEQFYRGYFAVGESAGVSSDLFHHLLYLLKVNSWTNTNSLESFYNIGLGKRFVKEFKQSLLLGKHTILEN